MIEEVQATGADTASAGRQAYLRYDTVQPHSANAVARAEVRTPAALLEGSGHTRLRKSTLLRKHSANFYVDRGSAYAHIRHCARGRHLGLELAAEQMHALCRDQAMRRHGCNGAVACRASMLQRACASSRSGKCCPCLWTHDRVALKKKPCSICDATYMPRLELTRCPGASSAPCLGGCAKST